MLENAPPGVHWFIFTEADSWWHFHNLAAEVKRIEDAVYPASPSKDFLVVGGGGFLISSSFMILSKASNHRRFTRRQYPPNRATNQAIKSCHRGFASSPH